MENPNLIEQNANRNKSDVPYQYESQAYTSTNDESDGRHSPLSGNTSVSMGSKTTETSSSTSATLTKSVIVEPEDAAQKELLSKDAPRKRVVGDTTCSNCTTKKTPLWRRDFDGNILCNACGLFLKLHGTARPIKLKSDTIKTRNRKSNNLAHFTLRNTPDSNYVTSLSGPNSFKVGKLQIRTNNNIPIITTPAIANFKKMRSMSDSAGGDNQVNVNNFTNIVDATKFMKPRLKPKPSAQKINIGGISYSHAQTIADLNKKMISLGDDMKLDGSPTYATIAIDDIRKMSVGSNESDMEIIDANYSQDDTEMANLLNSHEEMIKLKIRIKELELITDLYKSYIRRLNGKCNSLELRLQTNSDVTTG